jgi:hypothetical protein
MYEIKLKAKHERTVDSAERKVNKAAKKKEKTLANKKIAQMRVDTPLDHDL